jgi:hypothetical protein
MIRSVAYLFIAFLFCTLCKKSDNNDDTVDFSSLNGGNYILKVDRISKSPDVRFPNDSLNESYYTASDEGTRYEISFSEDGQSISIAPASVSGVKTNDSKVSKRYDLVQGVFAGGRFIIWTDNTSFQAEYTIYGSGVPIIKSERGKLFPIAIGKSDKNYTLLSPPK